MPLSKRIITGRPGEAGRGINLEYFAPCYFGETWGHRASLAAASGETWVRDSVSAPTFPTGEGTVTVTHPGASDGAGGAGAQAVTLLGVVDGEPVEWEIVLGAGSSTVDATYPGQVSYVNAAWVSQAGASEVNLADIQIDIGAVTTGTEFIAANVGRSRSAQFQSPATYGWFLEGVKFTAVDSGSADYAVFRLKSRPIGGSGPWRTWNEWLIKVDSGIADLEEHILLPAGHDIEFTAQINSGTATVQVHPHWVYLPQAQIDTAYEGA